MSSGPAAGMYSRVGRNTRANRSQGSIRCQTIVRTTRPLSRPYWLSSYQAWAAGDADGMVADYTADATAIMTGSLRDEP